MRRSGIPACVWVACCCLLFGGLAGCGGAGPVAPEPPSGGEDDWNQGDLVIDLPGGVKMAFMWIELGTFMMGESIPAAQYPGETPVHRVTLTKGFYIGRYEVTRQQWESLMGSSSFPEVPVEWQSPRHPVARVSWEQCQAFIAKLNRASGHDLYRLPTEAEWEYACRAGTTRSFSAPFSEVGDYAWYKDNSGGHPHEVGMKKPNPWGLYDMHGNVEEWVQDWYYDYTAEPQVDPKGPEDNPYTGACTRIRRGGYFDDDLSGIRSAFRHGTLVFSGAEGFRVVRTP